MQKQEDKILFEIGFCKKIQIQIDEIGIVPLEDSLLSYFYIRNNEKKYNLSFDTKLVSNFLISCLIFCNSPAFGKNSKDLQTISKNKPNQVEKDLKGKRNLVGGTITGYSYHRYMELCDLWMKRYKEENPSLEFSLNQLTKQKLNLDIILPDIKLE